MTTMKPGPELDALVAEKVMGWDHPPWPPWNLKWRPSTDIAHAWEVVEKMRKDGHGVFLSAHHQDNNQACLVTEGVASGDSPKDYILNGLRYTTILANEQAKEIPHAICLAALKVAEKS